MTPSKPKRRVDYVKEACHAHSDLNIFAAVVEILEGGTIYRSKSQPTVRRIIALCKAEQQRCLLDFDLARARVHEGA